MWTSPLFAYRVSGSINRLIGLPSSDRLIRFFLDARGHERLQAPQAAVVDAVLLQMGNGVVKILGTGTGSLFKYALSWPPTPFRLSEVNHSGE